MRFFLVVIFTISALLQGRAQNTPKPPVEVYANAINISQLEKYVKTLASEQFEGRKSGTTGGMMAASYIGTIFDSLGLQKPYGSSYFQHIEKGLTYFNVLGYIEGGDLKREVVIISAHYDHIGIKNGTLYPGAEENASGVAALLEIAGMFADAKKTGYTPRRSILFAAFDGAQNDLAGSAAYVENPLFSMENTYANLNMDKIGRNDAYPTHEENYVYIMGADRVSSELQRIIDSTNSHYTHLLADYVPNSSPMQGLLYVLSDQYVFNNKGVPSVLFNSGVYPDLQSVGDTPDKLSYEVLRRRAQLVFYTAWDLVYRPAPLVKDNLNTKKRF